jgi:hypothetical protein
MQIVKKGSKFTHHLKTKTGINKQEHQVSYFCYINHAVKIICTFYESQPSLLACKSGQNNKNQGAL